ncbi:MAG TPA: DNA recombination protein RmuC [Selenomonas sp.]|nr:DNA recombination protein RmuC [Selenomonadaceae bacterium]HCB93352.1 DNA recombination protein RmuC [Selenomonas sp.]
MTVEQLLLCLIFIALVLIIVLLLNMRNRQSEFGSADRYNSLLQARAERLQQNINSSVAHIGDGNLQAIRTLNDIIHKSNDRFRQSMSDSMTQLENRLQSLEAMNVLKFDTVKNSVDKALSEVREENKQQLEQIRETVNEKLEVSLERRISESFRNVSERLEQVHAGLGEMKSLANDVGGLKKVLSGVKTRGILGEIQLEAILQEILSPNQYEKNVATVPKSSNRVEFAVRLPGVKEEEPVYIPIDSKFPGDAYTALQDARQSGDREVMEEAFNTFRKRLLSEAKDIRDKYIYPPATTNFAIMFLPFEGLYAEVVNHSGLMEELQRKFHVNVTGPSTMAAFLNSLQMGFQTLAIQKRSNEVWEVLGAVKTEFEKFEMGMLKMQNHLNQTNTDLESLMGTRSKAIRRKLRQVEALDEGAAKRVLEDIDEDIFF